MGVINTGSIAKALWPGVIVWVGLSYKEYPPEYTKIFKKETSDKAYEEMVSLSSFGLATVKTEGGSISYDSMRQLWVTRATHVVYNLGFIVTREAITDNQYKSLAKQRSQALGFSMRQTKEIVHANLLNRAFNSTYTFGDGKELCATDHPTLAADFRNELTTAADLSGASLEQAGIDIAAFKNNRGLAIRVLPQALVIHPNERYNAERILKSSLEYDTANNAINVLRGEFPKGILVNHYLTDIDAFFITTDAMNGLTTYQRWPLELSSPEADFDTENMKVKATERFSVTAGDPRCIFGSPGA